MNSFFKKKPQRKWTWRSPDAVTKNEIDFILTDKRHIFRDVSVINRFSTGSDHRLVRGSLNIDVKLERSRLMKSTLRPNPLQIMAGSEKFHELLEARFVELKPTEDVDEALQSVVGTLRSEGIKFCQLQRTGKKSKLSDETLRLMTKRRDDIQATSSERSYLNKQIAKMVRRDLRSSNTRLIEEAIERNRGSKVFTQQLGRSHLTKLTTHDGLTVTSKPQILAEIEDFYGRLYAVNAPRVQRDNHDLRATLTRHYTDDLPEISQDEIVRKTSTPEHRPPSKNATTTDPMLLASSGFPLPSPEYRSTLEVVCQRCVYQYAVAAELFDPIGHPF
ncbi:uncharacterized protein LOC113233423 [Hyposmocoma kahamanoa]|uniref:uncharacterized protein LOC113233423 n=1 Tax=Hyposmocoma kahamanoa TaxID=1477025 RepID=UPI000E6D7A91|nr:uncharacterized protein LOC113233423 [Hyposmocoma kahamanoa]